MYLSLETLMTIPRTAQIILVELIYLVNSVIIFLSQMTLLRQLTFLVRFLIVTLTTLLFWIYLFLLTPAFVLQWLSFHCRILIMLSQFLSNSKRDAPFHLIAYNCSCVDWDSLRDHFRDVP